MDKEDGVCVCVCVCVKYYSSLEKKELLSFTTWMEEPGGLYKPEKYYCIVSCVEFFLKSQLIQIEWKSGCQRLGLGGIVEVCERVQTFSHKISKV